MSPPIVGIIGIGVLFALLAFRMHIGIAMAIVGFAGFSYLSRLDSALSILGQTPYLTSASYTMSVIPLFVLMGALVFHSGLGQDLYYSVNRWIGHLPGGLAMATIGACAGFAAVSGSTTASAATMGMVCLPEMRRYHYNPALATGTVAAGGCLGTLIPPSLTFIIYGQLTEQSIGKLFIAGILPGVLMAGLFMFSIYLQVRLNPALASPAPRASLRDQLLALKDIWGILILFLLVIGGIYLGLFTPTEAAGIGAFGAFLFTVIRKRLSWKIIRDSGMETVRTTTMIIIIIIGAVIFGYFLAISRLPTIITEIVATLGLSKHIVLSIIILVYLALGCIMSGLAIIVLLLPIVFPLIISLGFDPIWFGVITVISLEIGLLTPPVGMNVFVLAGIARDVPMYTIFRGIIKFFPFMILTLVILTIFPQIALFLPDLMK